VDTGESLLAGFNVSVDTSALPEGAAHHAEILGYEAPSPDSEVSQPLFRVPVCVMKPTGADISAAGAPEVVCAPPKSLQMSPGAIHRHFIAVPVGATWAEVTVTMDSYTGLGGDRRMLYMHALQLVPHVPFSLTEHKPRWFANQGDKKIHKFKVWGGRTLELTLAQFWSSLGSGLAGLSVTFHGVAVSTTDLVLDGAQSIARIDITAPESIGSAAVSPSASLTVQRRLLRPKAGASIVPLGERDLFPDEQVRRATKYAGCFVGLHLGLSKSYVPRRLCSALTSCNRSTR
jgi:tripeptidyl-peptidase-2